MLLEVQTTEMDAKLEKLTTQAFEADNRLMKWNSSTSLLDKAFLQGYEVTEGLGYEGYCDRQLKKKVCRHCSKIGHLKAPFHTLSKKSFENSDT